MELKRLIANDSKSALQCVRDECGDDALIVSTNKVGKKTEVIYAIDISEGYPKEGFQKTQADTARFSDTLGEIKKKQNNENSDVRNLLGQIQIELGTLKQKIDSQSSGRMHGSSRQRYGRREWISRTCCIRSTSTSALAADQLG